MKASAFGLLGKHSAHADFVAVEATGPLFTNLDQWLVNSMAWANSHKGASWPAAFSAGLVQAFVYRPPHSAWQEGFLVGAIQPSSDRVGRHFPLLAAAVVRTERAAMQVEALPIVLEPVWSAAQQALQSKPEKLTARPAPHLAAATTADLGESLALYREWTVGLSCQELWVALYGPGDVLDRASNVLLRFLECIRPYRGVEPSNTPLTLRLPLGTLGGAAVCFWLDLASRAAQWRSTIPNFFWTHTGDAGTLLLHLGDPPLCTVAELWLPSNERDEVCDLVSGASGLSFVARGPDAAQFSLGGGERVCDLLDLVSAWAPPHS